MLQQNRDRAKSILRHILRAAVLLVYCLAFSRASLFGQATTGPIDIGFPPNAVFHGSDLDFVNLDNGNLHIEIPLWSASGRGMPVGYRLIYDSMGFTSFDHCTRDGSCSSAIQKAPGNHMIMVLVGPFGYGLRTKGPVQRCGTQLTSPTVNVYTSTLIEANGTAHPLVPSQYYTDSSVSCSWWPLSPNLYANDGSGFVVEPGPGGPVRSKNGRIVVGVITDTNGNQLNPGNGSTIPATDTLGRTIPSDGSYYDSSGNHQLIQIVNTTVTLHTSLCQFAAYSPCQEYSTGNVSWTVPQKITFPNGQTFTITYVPNDYGEIASITLPTGGQISWGWGALDSGGRWVASRTVTTAGNSYTWNYGATLNGHTVTDPNGNEIDKICATSGTGGCLSRQMKYYAGSATSGQLLKTLTTDFTNKICDSGNCQFLPIRETATWNQTNQVTKTETDWEFTTISSTNVPMSWGNPIEQREYDYGVGSPGALLRKTDYTYLHQTNTSYLNANIADRVTSKVIYAGTSTTPSAQTTFAYDGSSLTPTSGAPNHDYTNFSTTNTVRGNLTQISRWVNTNSTWLNATNTYNDLGDLLSTTDPLNNTTSFSYADNFTDGINRNALAFVTQTTPPATNGVSHVERNQYYWNTSLAAASCGQNFPSASACTNAASIPQSDYTRFTYDSANRPLKVTRGDGGQTNYSYNDTVQPLNVSSTQSMTSNLSLTKTELFDGLGRVAQTQLNSDPDCPSGDKVDTTYDALGRVHTVSNPYCTTSDPIYGLTMYAYDALGRTTQVTHPDGNTMLTTYTGRATQVQDEGNGTRRVTRVSQADGLGRLASVCEVTSATQLGSGGTPSACGQDISATGFLTAYGYDALDNLTSVSQSGLNGRTFQYNSLSRLTSASNPESSNTTYGYDANGNVITKTDARGIVTCFGDWTGTSCNGSTGYDALNRILKKTYSDSTPSVSFLYDVASTNGVSISNPIGRLVRGTSGSCTQTINSYDAMGRIATQWFNTPSYCGPASFITGYTYDLADNITSFTNGGGETFSYTVSGASRLTTLTSSLSDSNHPGTLFSAAHYNAAGSMLSASLGGVITETRTYDSRLRLASIADGSNYSLTIPSSGGYAPNSDILAANDSVNGNWTYSYDDFNRLSGSNQNSGQAVYSYVYDRFGNRWQQNGPHPMQLSFSGANNRMDGYSYDAAGNLLNDGSHSYFYDAENRLIQVDGTLGTCSTATACYVYDAEGHRVQKTTSSGVASYIYDPAGHEVVQYGPTCSPCRDEIYAGGRHLATYNNSTTYFIHPDWLGTERARSSVSGAPYETCTSLPFGDWLTCSGGDPSPMHFTGKPHDTESGLDYFGARFDASSFGRFMSPDPVFVSAQQVLDPQGLNLYAYVRNNPLSLTDPTGLDFYLTCTEEKAGSCEYVQNGDNQVLVSGQVVDGSFQAYDIDMNRDGSGLFSDQFGNDYVGEFDENNGVTFINTTTDQRSSGSQFIDGSDPTEVFGTSLSAFEGIKATFFDACGGSCQGRATLTGTAEAFFNMKNALEKQGRVATLVDGLAISHPFWTDQWKGGPGGYVHLIKAPGYLMDMHFEGNAPGASRDSFVLHMVGTVKDIANGNALHERGLLTPGKDPDEQ